MNNIKSKYLYSFSIDKEIETEREVEEIVNGEKVKIKRKIKEKIPIHFAIKRPNRKIVQKADMFYGVTLSEGIRAGLLTKALLLKRYRNDGGALSEADATYFAELASRLSELEDEHQRLLINLEKISQEDRSEKMGEIVKEKMQVIQQLQNLETINQALFAHTAETKAQNELINWWIVHLSVWDEKGGEDYIDLGELKGTKGNFSYEIDENIDGFYRKILQKGE